MVLLGKRCKEAFSKIGEKGMILTMTTCFHINGRFANVQKFVDSFQKFHPLSKDGAVFSPYFDKVVFINDVNVNDQHQIVPHPEEEYYRSYFREVLPEVELIEKTLPSDKGQARSLNILIEKYLRHNDYKYWVHWEDSWVLSRPLFPEVVDIMDKSPEVHQIQLTDDWGNDPKNKTEHCFIIKNQASPEEIKRGIYRKLDALDLSKWPTFSLRPSINRLSFFCEKMYPFYFLEDPRLWPIWFEWEFARNFCRCGGVKAIPHKPFVSRVGGHKHSYSA